MKKLFLLLAVVGMALTACSEGGEDNPDIPADKTQAIKFQDANTKFICTIFWDKNGDGELSYKEAAAVTNLYTAFKDQSIIAFTELRYFTSLEKIEDSAFYGCSSLRIVTIPDSVTEIGEEAFYGCSSLTSITIPDSVITIGDSAFNGCSSLTSVTIGNSVTTIGYCAFFGCSSLTSVTIPDSVTEIVDYAFAWCISLTEFKGKFASEDGRCLIIDGTLNSFAPAGVTEYTIPDSVTTIGGYAFARCSSLTSVTIPDSVTTIGYCAFSGCSSLTSITIPDSVTAIGTWAFDECSSLESVYCKPTTPPSIGNLVFDDNASGRKIYVPAESVEAYKTAEGWSDYAYNSIVGYDF